MKRIQSLSIKLGIIMLIFLLIILGSCGVLMYYNQMNSYHKQCEDNLRNVSEYLEKQIEEDGEDFVLYQNYYLDHYTEVDIPVDAEGYVSYRTEYERLLQTYHPGKTLGVDIEFDELSDKVKQAFLIYRQLYWLETFEEARTSFGLSYVYYILPDSDTESDIYILDGVIDGKRISRADYIKMTAEHPDLFAAFYHPQGEEAEYMYLGDQVPNDRDEYDIKWSTWDSGKKQDGFQIWDNAYGKTYAYYTPVIVDGQKMGLIGAEIDIASVNIAILNSTLSQFLIIGIIFFTALLIMMIVFNQHFIRRITKLESNVVDYSKSLFSILKMYYNSSYRHEGAKRE